MSRSIASLTPEQLRQRFFLEESPYWWLQNATRKNELIGKFRDDDPEVRSSEEKLLYSWMQLEELLQTIPFGYGRVVLKKNPTDNIANSPQLYVSWGQTQGKTSSAVLSGTGGQYLDMERFYERMLTFQQKAHETQMEQMKTLMQMGFEKEQLEAEIEGLQEPGMNEMFLKEGMGLLRTVLAKPRPAGQLGTLGEGSEAPASGTKPTASTAEGNRPFSMDQAIGDINVIRKSLPGHHPNDVLRALALFCQSSPGQAESYITMLIQQVNG
ncbi:MAG: hypothetical protein AAF741_15640 [Bacteroidota bacterium]